MGDQNRYQNMDYEKVKNDMVKQFTKHIEEDVNNQADDDFVKVKLVVVGPEGSGKTSWVTTLTGQPFVQAHRPTVGARFSQQAVAIDESGDKVYNFEIWDVSGDQMYKTLVPMYLQYAQAVVVCYDAASTNSFEEAKEWIKYVKDIGQDIIVAFVGMKSDLAALAANPVDKTVARDFFENELKMDKEFFFPEVSAKTNDNVQEVLLAIAERIHDSGVRAPRGSVMDPETAYKFATKEAEKGTNNFYKKFVDPYINEEARGVYKEKVGICTAWTRRVMSVCFENSKAQAAKTYESTKKGARELSATLNRQSRKFGRGITKRTARLVNGDAEQKKASGGGEVESIVNYEEDSPEYRRISQQRGKPMKNMKIEKLKG